MHSFLIFCTIFVLDMYLGIKILSLIRNQRMTINWCYTALLRVFKRLSSVIRYSFFQEQGYPRVEIKKNLMTMRVLIKSIKTMVEEKDRLEEERRRFEEGFNFNGLATELKHEVFKKFKTKYLEEVCGKVSREWLGMVEDILEQRTINAVRMVPTFFQKEMAMRTCGEVSNNPLEMLKFFEGTMLSKKFDATSVEVNSDVLHSRTGLIQKLWGFRECECDDVQECIIRGLHLLPAFDLFVFDCPAVHGSLQFYNLSEIERLNMNENPDDFWEYECPKVVEWIGTSHKTNTGISVFRDHIVTETAAKTILLLKVDSVDHTARVVNLSRIRIIHLPIWAYNICLFEDKLMMLYTTGFVGMWDKGNDELFMSTTKCDLGETSVLSMHRTKLYRIGSLCLIKTEVAGNGRHRWYVVDPNNPSLRIHQVEMPNLMNAGLCLNNRCVKAIDVLHIDVWYNCIIIHMSIEGLEPSHNPPKSCYRLAFKRIHQYPTVEDFLDPEKFCNDFIRGTTDMRMSLVKANFRYAFTSPFTPTSLKPWQLEPPADEPVPVADLVAVHLATSAFGSSEREKLKVFRIRISNLPFIY